MYGQQIFKKEQRQYSTERVVFLENGNETTVYPCSKKLTWTYVSPMVEKLTQHGSQT